MKIAPGLIQFTAIDDCTRLRVLGLYPRRTAVYARRFLEERVLEEFPFPVQRIQTDRGGEFFGQEFQLALRANAVKFRPIRPRSPHLNGKVKRSQQTDLREFWPSVSLDDPRLGELLEEWQFYYNWFPPHSALKGRTPMERCIELAETTPLHEDLEDTYDASREPLRIRNYADERTIQRLKRSP